MSSINVRAKDKARFQELQDDDQTQKELFAELLRTYENADETVTIDTESVIEQVAMSVTAEVENAAYRGVTDAIEQANK